MIYSGLNSPAFHRPSDNTSLPSASVFNISIVFPDKPLITSPGLVALAAGIFSAIQVIPTTLPLWPVCANASIVPNTVAEPPMSYFISSMPAPGLSEIPPVSKVIPLPTKTGHLPFTSLFISKIIMHGLRDEPLPTATKPPIPAFIAWS